MISYLQQLEILAFFSGYPLVYAAVAFLRTTAKSRSSIKYSAFILLPFSYTIVGILYLGLQLRNLFPDYSVRHIASQIQIPFYAGWALLSLAFWIPFLSKKPVLSLLHSLVFFYLIVKTFYLQLTSTGPDKHVLSNFMKVYSDSILLNTVVLIVLLIIYRGVKFFRQRSSLPH